MLAQFLMRVQIVFAGGKVDASRFRTYFIVATIAKRFS